MAFKLGNFNIDEILYGTAQNFNDDLLYTLDQLSSASIELSSDPTEFTDKNGNVVRTVYKQKTGTFTATNAFLHVDIMNMASGSAMQEATEAAPVEMPKIEIVSAGGSVTLKDAVEGTVRVIGLFGSGANGKTLTQSPDNANYENGTFQLNATADATTVRVPNAHPDHPVQYLVKYQRLAKGGLKLTNSADIFPDTVRLTLYCSYVDPCSDTLRPCYVYLPSFQADPSCTISLDKETQEMDFNGTLQVSYCSADKALYYIYFPEENIVATGAAV